MSASKKDDPKKGEGEGQQEGDKPKFAKKKLIIFAVLGIVLLIGGAGVAAMSFLAAPPDSHKDAKNEGEEEYKEPEEPHREMVSADLGQFIVNLSDMSSFLKIRILIEYDTALIDRQLGIHKDGETGGEASGGGASGGAKEAAGSSIHPHMAKLEHKFRDIIIRILSSKRADELLTVEGKDRLKEQLRDGLNEAVGLAEPPIEEIYFSEFMIQ
jgi:flagellar basal body-associated protein FliL